MLPRLRLAAAVGPARLRDVRLELRATGELIGFAGLVVPQLFPEVMPAVDVGWRVGCAFWGRGLVTEAAVAALRFGLIGRDLGQIMRQDPGVKAGLFTYEIHATQTFPESTLT